MEHVFHLILTWWRPPKKDGDAVGPVDLDRPRRWEDPAVSESGADGRRLALCWRIFDMIYVRLHTWSILEQPL